MGSPRFLTSLFLRATLSDPDRPSRISPLRSLCVGFRNGNTVAACFIGVTRLNRLGECGLPCGPQDSLCTLRIFRSVVVDFLLHIRNTRYGWLVRPYPTGTLTLKEMPSFAWRTTHCRQFCPIGGTLTPSFRRKPIRVKLRGFLVMGFPRVTERFVHSLPFCSVFRMCNV